MNTFSRVASVAMVVVAASAAAPHHATGQSDHDAVLRVVDDLFDGMRSRQEATLRGVFHPRARLMSAGMDAEGNPTVSETAAADFVSGIVNSSRTAVIDERTYDPVVRLDGNLATVWVEYDLYIGDDFSHCGVDAFQMARTPDGWKIIHLADTRRREGCPPR